MFNLNFNTRSDLAKNLSLLFFLLLVIISFIIAFLPEQSAKLLTDSNRWGLKGLHSSQLSLLIFLKDHINYTIL